METPSETQLLNFCLKILRCTRQELEERYLSVRELCKATKENVSICDTKHQLLVRVCSEDVPSLDKKLKDAFSGIELPKFEKKRLVLTKNPRKVLSVFLQGEDKFETFSRIGCIKNLESLSFSEKQLGEDADAVIERIHLVCPQVRIFLHPEDGVNKVDEEESQTAKKSTAAKWGSASLKKFTYHEKFFPKGWEEFFNDNKEVIKEISDNLSQTQVEKITPPLINVWKAFKETPRNSVKVVILGQDPYPTPGNAMGLAFSVKKGKKIAASLANIAEEVEKQGFKLSGSGDLTCWAQQGVLLLNTALTTLEGEMGAHVKIWGEFSREVIRHLNENCSGVVYILWGAEARKFRDIISAKRNCILECAHPSPMSVKGFRNNNHFISANEYLEKNGKETIDWSF